MTRNEIITASCSRGGMFCVIPTVVMRDNTLSLSAKILYGIITWKCNENAYCWASNRTLGEEISLSVKRVSALISDLERQGHIETELIRDDSGQILHRYIYPIVQSSRGILENASALMDTYPQEQGYPIPGNEDTPPQACAYPPPENEEEKYKGEIKRETLETLKPLKKGRKRREPKAGPDWKPERFAGFWDFYSHRVRGESKQAAIRAWDKLRPDDALIDQIAAALLLQIKTPDWVAGIGIPYASTYLNNQRWTDVPKPPSHDAPAEASGGWAEDPEVL